MKNCLLGRKESKQTSSKCMLSVIIRINYLIETILIFTPIIHFYGRPKYHPHYAITYGAVNSVTLTTFIGLDKRKIQRKIVNICLPIILSICCGCSKEPSHRDDSFEYPQHMFYLRNKIFFLVRTLN